MARSNAASPFPLKSSTGRRSLNLDGGMDAQRLSAVVRLDKTIDAHSTTLALFEQVEACLFASANDHSDLRHHPLYYRSTLLTGYLQHSRIRSAFLPAYSPNIDLLDRFWHFFKRQCSRTGTK